LATLKIPLARPYASEEDLEAIRRVMTSGQYIHGSETKQFESEFASFIGTKHAVATSSGTAALHLALLSTGVGENDEVITVSHTFIATIESIWYVRAKPKLIDIDPRYYVMDIEAVRTLINEKTRAIIPVHVFGHPVDMDPLRKLAEEHGLKLIEDAAQAHGSLYKDRPVGTLGDVACFSFYPSKNLTVCGDGGMLVTNDAGIAQKARMLRDHGRTQKYSSDEVGYNYRLSEIASAIGRVGLKQLPRWNIERRSIASHYSRLLSADDQVIPPAEAGWARHVYHVYAIRTKDRDKLALSLAQNGIQTGIHYPIPCHLQPVFKRLENSNLYLKNTEQVANELLSLPIFPGMSAEEVERVAHKVREFHEQTP
jgi:dTDP-4-amino-4,6-dideoxygalactose transaminase